MARAGQDVELTIWWHRGPQRCRVIGGMVALLDLIYLLKNTKNTLHWEQILDWLDGSVASTHLYLMLTYLDKYQLIDVALEILHGLFLRQQSFGNVNLKSCTP